MQNYDLCLPWYWLYDHDFIRYIGEACSAQGVTFWQITPTNLLQGVAELYTGLTTFSCLLDRANDDLRFEPIRRFAREHHLERINAPELSRWAEDKATMHLELMQAGLQNSLHDLDIPVHRSARSAAHEHHSPWGLLCP